jgi:hypothetical protein
MRESSMHENREIPAVPGRRPRRGASQTAGGSGKASGHKPDAKAAGKSDTSVVPRKAGNKAPTWNDAGYGGTVNPSRNRKSGTGNPPPAAGGVTRTVGRRTGWREGW